MKSSIRFDQFASRAIGARHQHGVTLIEILITLLVLAVGLLGLAALQGLSLQTGQVAYQRSQAVNIAYEVADYARANRSRSNVQADSQALAENLAQARLPAGTAQVTVTNGQIIDVTIGWSEDRLEDLEDSPAQEVTIRSQI